MLLVIVAGAVTAVVAQTKPAIDVCGIVTPPKAKAVLGEVVTQPPVKTDHAGFGVDACVYMTPVHGAGANVSFLRLTVQAGTGKEGPDMLQTEADMRKATLPLTGVGEAAKRNQAGTFIWAKQGSVGCTAEIANGLPKTLTADSAAAALGGLCRDVLAARR
jgi:hypothetical protein